MIRKIIFVASAISIVLLLYVVSLSLSQDAPKLTDAPHYATEITIAPHTDPELAGTFQLTVKLKNLETEEEISGPNLVLVKGLENTAGTGHDWAHLDTFIKASCDEGGKTINYSLDIYYKGDKIGNSTCSISLEEAK